jgi:hypothetical protein
MRRLALNSWVIVALCVCASRGLALTQPLDDMCSQPTMKTDKWKPRDEVAGMHLLLPPGFVSSGASNMPQTRDSHYFVNGEHRSIGVGSGSGPDFFHYQSVSETGECETVIAGRRVVITLYRWVNEDQVLSASGDAGAHFAAIARFYAAGALREAYVELFSNSPSDLKYFRQLFWTVSFPGASESPAAGATLVSATPAPASDPKPASDPPPPGSAPPPTTCASVAGLPAADAVLDSAVVRTLIASAAPIPKGFEVMALQFSSTGDLSGMSVAQSDLPQASQHELSSVVATNLKPHDAHDVSTFLLRIDSGDTGLRFAVLPIAGCTH